MKKSREPCLATETTIQVLRNASRAPPVLIFVFIASQRLARIRGYFVPSGTFFSGIIAAAWGPSARTVPLDLGTYWIDRCLYPRTRRTRDPTPCQPVNGGQRAAGPHRQTNLGQEPTLGGNRTGDLAVIGRRS